jgi:hypothetical protein
MPAKAGIHVFLSRPKDVDGRDKPGHDGCKVFGWSYAAKWAAVA